MSFALTSDYRIKGFFLSKIVIEPDVWMWILWHLISKKLDLKAVDNFWSTHLIGGVWSRSKTIKRKLFTFLIYYSFVVSFFDHFFSVNITVLACLLITLSYCLKQNVSKIVQRRVASIPRRKNVTNKFVFGIVAFLYVGL